MIQLFSYISSLSYLYCNELIFFVDNLIIALTVVVASRLGKTALTAFVVVAWILANFLVQKEITLFGIDVITSDAFAVGFNSALLLLSSYYGPKSAQHAIKVSCFLILFFLVVSQMHILYIPNIHDMSDSHYQALFGSLPRILCSSVAVSGISSYLNLMLFIFFSRIFSFVAVSLRQGVALIVSQIMDTILFAYLALYGTVSSLTSIIIFSSCVKIAAIGINIFLIAAVQRYLPKPHDAL